MLSVAKTDGNVHFGGPIDQLPAAPDRVVGVHNDEHGVRGLHIQETLVAVDLDGADQLDLLAVLVDETVNDAEGVILFLPLQKDVFIVFLKERDQEGKEQQQGRKEQ